jgi:hypothetical protein
VEGGGGSGAEGIVVVCAHRMVVVVTISGRRMTVMEMGLLSLSFRAASEPTAGRTRSSTDWDLRACCFCISISRSRDPFPSRDFLGSLYIARGMGKFYECQSTTAEASPRGGPVQESSWDGDTHFSILYRFPPLARARGHETSIHRSPLVRLKLS